MSWFPTLISCSPNLTRVYIRLCKHRNHFTFLQYNNGWVLPIDFSSKRGRKTQQWDQEDQQWNKRFNRKKEYHRSKETVYCLFFFFFALLVSGCFTCPICELLSTRTIFSRTHRGWKILKVRWTGTRKHWKHGWRNLQGKMRMHWLYKSTLVQMKAKWRLGTITR